MTFDSACLSPSGHQIGLGRIDGGLGNVDLHLKRLLIELHKQVESMPLGVNREKAARAAEEAALQATPTHQMKGLLA